MGIFALIHRQTVVDVVETESDARPARCGLPGAYWVDISSVTPTPTRGQRYDGFSFNDP